MMSLLLLQKMLSILVALSSLVRSKAKEELGLEQRLWIVSCCHMVHSPRLHHAALASTVVEPQWLK